MSAEQQSKRSRNQPVVDRTAYRKGTCFNPDKKKFHTLADAERACAKIDEKQPNKHMRHYQCGNHWHLTSKPDFKVAM